MEAEEFLKLFDSCWFEPARFTKNGHEVPSPSAKSVIDKREGSIMSGVQKLQIRSLSDRCLGINVESPSHGSLIIKPKLQKILSGEEVEFSREVSAEEENAVKSRSKKSSRRRKKGREGMSRSLSALEFEEVKGFMDLGFVFDEENKNSSLCSIVPGLQKRGKMADYEDGKGEISRPYLSEAWGSIGNKRRGDDNFLIKWEFPSVNNEISMKDHLRFWAHTVASNVR